MRIKLQTTQPLPPRQVYYAVPDSLLASSTGAEKTTVQTLCHQIARDLRLPLLPEFGAHAELVLSIQGFELLPEQPFSALIQQNELLRYHLFVLVAVFFFLTI